MRSVLYWSTSCVRFHDVKNGRWTDVAPRPSESAALLWCAVNGVRFVKDPERPVSIAGVLGEVKSGDRADLPAASRV
jgi:hypothetical protein